jgi:predicted PurR-regulated permease PerM
MMEPLKIKEVPALSAELEPVAEHQSPLFPIPLDLRSVSLSVLAVLAVVAALHLAASLLVPLVFGLLISYALDPVISWLGRWKIPRPLSAAVLLLGILASLGSLAYSLRDDAVAIVDQLPEAAQNIRARLREVRLSGPGAIEKMQTAASEIEKTAAEAAGSKTPSRPIPQKSSPFELRPYLWSGSLGVITLASQALVVLFLVYFILASGDLYKRKLVQMAGPTLAEKRVTVEILDHINRQIGRFLFVQTLTSVIAAVMTWAALAGLGLEHAGVWGIAAGIANFIPYFGPIIVAGIIAVAAFLQFETLSMAALIGGVSLAIKGFVAFVLTPLVMSKAARMNPVAVFVALLIGGWLWGVWGMLLAMPITMVVKVVCDHIENLKPIGDLLGE